MADLTLERQAAQRELASLGTELRELLPDAGCGEQTMAEQMADLQERIDQTERRLREILRELRESRKPIGGRRRPSGGTRQFEPYGNCSTPASRHESSAP